MLALAPARRAGLTVPSLGPVQGCVSFVKEVRLARGELANVCASWATKHTQILAIRI